MLKPIKKKTVQSTHCLEGMCLHASAVNISNRAILFVGHSTSGKSTISRLLAERYSVIADDKVWVNKKNGGWVVQSVIEKFPIKKDLVRQLGQDQYPLIAVLRIFKSNSIKINSISQLKACKYIMDSIFEIEFQRNLGELKKKKLFKLAAELSRQMKGYVLTFPKNKTIIQTIYDNFEKNRCCE